MIGAESKTTINRKRRFVLLFYVLLGISFVLLTFGIIYRRPPAHVSALRVRQYDVGIVRDQYGNLSSHALKLGDSAYDDLLIGVASFQERRVPGYAVTLLDGTKVVVEIKSSIAFMEWNPFEEQTPLSPSQITDASIGGLREHDYRYPRNIGIDSAASVQIVLWDQVLIVVAHYALYCGLLCILATVCAAIFSRLLWRTVSESDCCASCGYSLAGLNGGACPECGTSRSRS